MDRNYYRQYYDLERSNWWFVARSSIISQCLEIHTEPLSPKKILNIGVATGATSDMLKKFGTVISSEFDAETCTFLRQVLKMEVIEASVTELPFPDNEFDLVCAFDVIEHVENDEQAMEEMKRVCKKGGYVAITVPADKNLWSPHDVINHHFRRYSLSEMENLVSARKLQIMYISCFNSILYWPIRFVRFFKNLIQKKDAPTSDFDTALPALFNHFLLRLFSFEKTWLGKKKISFGVSLICICKK
ncbi:MAG: class I SAM-dependent methyltransferase [Saprospiraceae bacterium]|nr:class I SAM-dependent methyltransferase [Saprospiraceae bacterium]MBK8372150.1 class I SAM-dependent methyltransferase [Saprospiraceae bacterium]MBK8547417.1 class I SAM-dependent methyltransferase [Saprospiraceae bacterium]MBK8818630.1 class I SAM-dependent methyltransferase [Saprospiraceae bacterium]MBK8852761.1 class I SAM-dependent methyltransferase [Saprospiraceae bacterium]